MVMENGIVKLLVLLVLLSLIPIPSLAHDVSGERRLDECKTDDFPAICAAKIVNSKLDRLLEMIRSGSHLGSANRKQWHVGFHKSDRCGSRGADTTGLS